jgi:histidine triad (HIT) family protein
VRAAPARTHTSPTTADLRRRPQRARLPHPDASRPDLTVTAPPTDRAAVPDCLFCRLAHDPDTVVWADDDVAAFLDIRPLFHGHTLVVPRRHVVTLDESDSDLLVALFSAVQRVQRVLTAPADENGTGGGAGAQGTFVANNNVVSQSVPHLHVHVVPRTKGDGLRGSFWPRTTYDADGPGSIEAWRARLRAALAD